MDDLEQDTDQNKKTYFKWVTVIFKGKIQHVFRVRTNKKARLESHGMFCLKWWTENKPDVWKK